MEYKIIGKGHVIQEVSNIFLNLSYNSGKYRPGKDKCSVELSNLDASAKYLGNGQKLIIDGKDSNEFLKMITDELAKRKFRLK